MILNSDRERMTDLREMLGGRVRIEVVGDRVQYFKYPHIGPHPSYDELRAECAEIGRAAFLAWLDADGTSAVAARILAEINADGPE